MRYISMFLKLFSIILFFAFSLSVQASSIDNAKNWLVLEINSEILDPEQNSTVNTLALASQSAKQSALAMEDADSLASLDTQALLTPFDVGKETNTTEYLSAKILTHALLGNDTSIFTEKLLTTQHKDGGFGHTTCRSSTVLDTALALESLSATNERKRETTKAVNYLLAQQNSDGSWKTTQEDELYTTAIALRALWLHRKSYNVQAAIGNAKSYLLAHKNTDGSYGSETFETALVLRSIAPLEYDRSNLQLTMGHLDTLQQASGSWEEDIYTTALVLQALLLADKEVPNPDLASLQGVVVDGDTGIALSDIEVHLVSDENRTLTTTSDGKFFFEGLRNGSYTLYIEDSSYAPLQTTLNFSGNDIDLGMLRINKNVNATVSTLTGVIKDKQTGEPIEGVVIKVGNKQSATDSQGIYIISSIEAGSYAVSISKAGYLQNGKTIDILANTILYYNTSLNMIDFTIEATVKGVVVDQNTTLPLEGVLVGITGASTKNITTTTDGQFSFSKLGQGDYILTISKDGYRAVTSSIQVSQTTIHNYGSIVLSPIDPADTSVALQGTVTQAPENIPLEGVVISVGVLSTTSDALGKYTLAGLVAGDMNITASRDGYISVLAQASSAEGSTVVFSPAMQKNDTNLSIFGTILDSNSSEPIGNVQVNYVGENNMTVHTNTQGHYIITPVAAGDVTLSYSKLGYDTLIFDVAVKTNNLNLSPLLHPTIKDSTIQEDNNATLTGIVLDSTTNEPLGEVTIHIVGEGLNTTIISESNGIFALGNISPYDLNLTFIYDNYKTVETMVVLAKDEQFDMGQVRMRPLSADVLLPDLVVQEINISKTSISQSKLLLDGTIDVNVTNQGTVITSSGFSVIAFYDVNKDGNYTQTIDTLLGTVQIDNALDRDENLSVSIDVNGSLPYVNAPILVSIDADTQVVESDESNNITDSSSRCTVVFNGAVGKFNPVVKWHWNGNTSSVSNSYNPYSAPIIVPIDSNKNGKIESNDDTVVIFQTHILGRRETNDIVLRAINGKTGNIVWENTTSQLHFDSDIAAGDIDNDGIIEVIGLTYDHHLRAFEDDGSLKWESSDTVINFGSVALSDLNADGKVEIIVGNEVFDSNGNKLWSGNGYSGEGAFPKFGTSIVADLNNDGSKEVIAGPSVYDANGTLLWQNNIGDGYTAIADFDGDEQPDIVLIAQGKLYLLNGKGEIVWGPTSLPGSGHGGSPTIADVDGDGKPEIGIAGGDYYVVFETDGSIKWKSPTYDHSSHITGSSVFDFEGDGKAEIVYADERYLRIYDGETGSILYSLPNSSGTAHEIPIIADADKDGHADIIFISNKYSTQTSYGVKMISDVNNTWVSTRSIWNQHSYHISNVNDDGTIPKVEESSWLTHNTYRLNAFPDHDARTSPDLSVSLLRLRDTAESNLSLSVRVGNGGSDKLRRQTIVAFYDGDPSSGGILLGKQNITTLDRGAYTDITLSNIATPVNDTIYVVVDPENRVNECNEENNQMYIPATLYSPYAKILVTTNKASYTANELVQLQGITTNLGKLEANLSAQLTLTDLEGNTIQVFDAQPLGIVASQETKGISNEWNTTNYLVGEYLLKGILTDKNGVIVDESNATFNIVSDLQGSVVATLDLSLDGVRYRTTDQVQMNNFVQSVSSNSIINNARVELLIKDSNGTVVQMQTLALDTLLPLASKEANYQYSYTRLLVGGYSVEATFLGNGNTIFATDSKHFTIYEDLAEALKGSLSLEWDTATVGTAQTCSYSLSHLGSSYLDAQPFALRVINLDNNTIIDEHNSTVELNSTQTITGKHDFLTSMYGVGTFSCGLYIEMEGSWKLLDHKLFTLTNTPPVAVDDVVTLEQDHNITIDILANDSDKEDSSLSINNVVFVSSVGHGTLSIVGNRVLYQPESGYHGMDSFSYTVTDSMEAISNNANVSIEVTPPPIEIDGEITVGVKGRVLALVDPCKISHNCNVDCGCNGWSYGYRKHGSRRKHEPHGLHDNFNYGSQKQCSEPYGPQDAPLVAAQQQYLEAYLKAQGYSTTIVTSNEAFKQALRSGTYDTYLVLSETVHLERTVQKELREAIFKGEQLLIAGMHDNRNSFVSSISGIRYQGRYWSVDTVESVDDTLTYIERPLMDRSFPIRIANCNATTLLKYSTSSCYARTEPAAVLREYGAGHAIFVGFDILAEASKEPSGEFEQLFGELLGKLQNTNRQSPRGIIPLSLNVENLGMTVPLRVELSIIEGQFVAATDAVEFNATNVLFTENTFLEEAQKAYYFWVQATQIDSINVKARLISTLNGEAELQKTLYFTQELQATVPINTVLEHARELQLHYWSDRHKLRAVIWALGRAKRDSSRGYHARALRRLLYASDKLARVYEATKVKTLRIDIDHIIRTTEITLSKAGE